jgi:hypothetical protein
VRAARRALNATSARGHPLWLTELGWSARGPTSRYRAAGDTHAERERTQARYLRTAYRKLFDTSRDYGVRGAFWFSLADYRRRPGSADRWYHYSGLFDRGGAPRLAWKAMKCVTGAGTCRY